MIFLAFKAILLNELTNQQLKKEEQDVGCPAKRQ